LCLLRNSVDPIRKITIAPTNPPTIKAAEIGILAGPPEDGVVVAVVLLGEIENVASLVGVVDCEELDVNDDDVVTVVVVVKLLVEGEEVTVDVSIVDDEDIEEEVVVGVEELVLMLIDDEVDMVLEVEFVVDHDALVVFPSEVEKMPVIGRGDEEDDAEKKGKTAIIEKDTIVKVTLIMTTSNFVIGACYASADDLL
jgi:hypothetical protein